MRPREGRGRRQRTMVGLFTILDGLIASYLVLFFPVRPIGWLLALIICYRIWKDVTPPYDWIPFNFGGSR